MTRDTDISYRVWQRHSLKEYRRARLDWITVACPDQLLANKLKQASHSIDGYDPFYANYPRHLENRHDFVTCTEVVEHFRLPDLEFPCLFELLKPGGLLGLMTELAIDAKAFAGRHHKNDMTHISFYSRPTPCDGWLSVIDSRLNSSARM